MNQDLAQKIIELNKQSYDSISSEFSKSREYIWPVLKYLASFVSFESRVLDVGCGNGRMVEVLPEGIKSYLGMDFSESLIKLAKNKFAKDNIKFISYDILKKWPAENDSIDAVSMIAVLNHIPSRELRMQVMKEAYRVLSPGGYLLMTNFNMWRSSFLKKGILKYIMNRLKMQDIEWQANLGFSVKGLGFRDVITLWEKDDKKAYLYYYAFTLQELIRLGRGAGLKLVEAFWEKDGMHAPFYKADNLVTVFKKEN